MMCRLKQILRELKCKWFGHRWYRQHGRGWGLGQKLVQRHSILNRKGGKKRNQLVYRSHYSFYACSRCGLTTTKLRKGEKLYEDNE